MNRRNFLQSLSVGLGSGPALVQAAAQSVQSKELTRAAPLDLAAPIPGAWSFVLLPDTQCYSDRYPEVFLRQTEWIVRERQARNIQFVLHLGDITDANTHPMWQNAHRAMEVLRAARIPTLIASGNHDLGPWGRATDRRSFFSDYFVQHNGRTMFSRNIGESENAYRFVTVGAAKFLLLSLEFGPRDAVVDWANEVLTKHSDCHAILITHAYLYNDSTRYDWGFKGKEQSWNPHAYSVAESSEGVNDGEELWHKLVKRHPQFAFVFNGHVLGDGTGQLESKGNAGNSVHQILVNYQCGTKPDRRNGGGGFLRVVEVHPDGRAVEMKDYSPYYDEWLTDGDRRFSLSLDRDLNEPYTGGSLKPLES